MFKIYFIIFLLSLPCLASANEFKFQFNYFHLRSESDQSAFPSSVIYDPTAQIDINYTFKFNKNNSIGLGASYAQLNPDSNNANLFFKQEKFDDINAHAFYSYLFESGVRVKLLGGLRSFPLYEIDGLNLGFSEFQPIYYGLSLALVTDNKLGKLSGEYIYKHINKESTDDDHWQGYEQGLNLDYNFKWFDYALGVYFNYGFSLLTSDNNNEFKTDIRSLGIYYKLNLK